MRKRAIAIIFQLCLIVVSTAFAASHRQRLTVVVAVDGMHREDMNSLRGFWQQGGLRTLDEEAFQTEMSLPNIVYGGAETVVTLMSGTTPSEHGITYNEYFNRSDRQIHGIFEDKTQEGIGCNKNISPTAIKSLTLTDRFRLLNGKSAGIYAIGIDPYTTLALAGHSANTCCWFDSEQKHWVTTTYYAEGLPAAADRQNTSGRIEQLSERVWVPRMDISQYMCPTDDERKHPFSYSGFADAHTAVTNTLVCELALDIQKDKHLGEDATPDMLLLQMTVLSPKAKADRIQTAEQEDMYLSLNQDLGYLMEQLDSRIGRSNYQLLVVGLPRLGLDNETLSEVGLPQHTFNVDRAVALTGTYLMALYGHERWIDGGYGQAIYLNRTLIEQKKLSVTDIQQQVSDFLLGFDGVQGSCPANILPLLQGGGEQERIRLSLNKQTAGDVVFWLEENHVSMMRENNITDKVTVRSPHIPLYLWSGALRQFPDKEAVTALNIYELLFNY